jgi:ABC-type bacteriocin/lantibiotic exporter with double-glycine peptidase domain
MMNTANIFPAMMGAFGLLFLVLFFFLMLIWIVLPFAVFGIKDLLREIIAEQKRTNELLKDTLKTREDFKPTPADEIEEEKDKGL